MKSKTLYWEDFTPGAIWGVARSEPVDRMSIITFAREFDPLDIHTDLELANQTPLGIHCASGIHTLAMAQRMLCDAVLSQSNIIVGGRIDNLIMISPVQHGDMLRLFVRARDRKSHSRSADRGWVSLSVCVSKNEALDVMTYETSVLMCKRAVGV